MKGRDAILFMLCNFLMQKCLIKQPLSHILTLYEDQDLLRSVIPVNIGGGSNVAILSDASRGGKGKT